MEEPASDLGKIKVMIIDDNASIRKTLRKVFENSKNLEVIAEAESGESALEVLCSVKPQVMLIDMKMSRMGGIELIKRVSSTYPEIKKIALTVYEDEMYVEEAIKGGADGYVVKGSSVRELIGCIENVIKGHKFITPELGTKLLNRFAKVGSALDIFSKLANIEKKQRSIILKVLDEMSGFLRADICLALISNSESELSVLIRRATESEEIIIERDRVPEIKEYFNWLQSPIVLPADSKIKSVLEMLPEIKNALTLIALPVDEGLSCRHYLFSISGAGASIGNTELQFLNVLGINTSLNLKNIRLEKELNARRAREVHIREESSFAIEELLDAGKARAAFGLLKKILDLKGWFMAKTDCHGISDIAELGSLDVSGLKHFFENEGLGLLEKALIMGGVQISELDRDSASILIGKDVPDTLEMAIALIPGRGAEQCSHKRNCSDLRCPRSDDFFLDMGLTKRAKADSENASSDMSQSSKRFPWLECEECYIGGIMGFISEKDSISSSSDRELLEKYASAMSEISF